MKPTKHKLSTPDLELLITNLKAFVVKVEEDKENQEYDMVDNENCVFSKTMNVRWNPNEVSDILIGEWYVGEYCEPLNHTNSKLFKEVFKLFDYNTFYKSSYNQVIVTKQQWLKVANKVVLKLEKKLWKRQAKAVQKSMDTDLVM